MSDSLDSADPVVAPSSTPVTAGRLLREAREAAGLHIASLAVSLKVPVRKLELLEADRFDELPDAVFCANDQMAMGFLRAMDERGIHAPDDIAVIGFDDIPLSRYVKPAISTIGTSRLNWGSTAARQLIGFLEKETPFQPQRIPTYFLPRESSTLQRNA